MLFLFAQPTRSFGFFVNDCVLFPCCHHGSSYNRELNWLARKDALLVSLYGEKRPFKKGSTNGFLAANATATKLGTKSNKIKASKVVLDPQDPSNIPTVNDKDIPPHNILARLRRRGYMDVLRICISWV